MTTVGERLDAAATKAEAASEIARQWANGPQNTTIPTSSGQLPTLAEFMRQKGAAIDAAANMISNGGIKSLQTVAGPVQSVQGFYAGGKFGGGEFYYDPDMPKAGHNGGTIIAPEALSAWNGLYSGLATFLNWTGSGTGCFVRITSGTEVDLAWFGVGETIFPVSSLAKAVSAAVDSSTIVGRFNNATVDGNLYVGSSFKGTRIDISGIVNLNGFNFTIECTYKRFNFDSLINTQTSQSSLIVKDSYGCKVTAVSIDGSNYPVKIYSNRGSGCFNNEITVYRTRSYGDQESSCWLVTVDGGGFANENHLRAGFMTGQRGMYFKKGVGQTAKFDGNKIIAPMFELIDYRGIEFQFSNFNHMFDSRFEASHTPSDVWIHEREDCYHQRYSGSQPVHSNKLRLLGEKTQYLAPLYSAEGDTSIGFRFASLMHWRGIGENEGFGFAQCMSNSSPNGTIALRKDLGSAPFTQYALWIKDYSGNVIGAGEVNPYGFIETAETDTGDIVIASNISWIQCRPPTTSTATVSLVMPASKQSEGREITLWLCNTRFAQVEIKNAAGASHLPAGTFTAEGIWKLFYRYSKWRAYFVGNNIKL